MMKAITYLHGPAPITAIAQSGPSLLESAETPPEIAPVAPMQELQFIRPPVPYVYAHLLDDALPAVASVKPGTCVVVAIAPPADAESRSERDWFTDRTPKRSGITGPIVIEGAAPGDKILAEIRSIELSNRTMPADQRAKVAISLDPERPPAPNSVETSICHVSVGDRPRFNVHRPGAFVSFGPLKDADGRSLTGRVAVIFRLAKRVSGGPLMVRTVNRH